MFYFPDPSNQFSKKATLIIKIFVLLLAFVTFAIFLKLLYNDAQRIVAEGKSLMTTCLLAVILVLPMLLLFFTMNKLAANQLLYISLWIFLFMIAGLFINSKNSSRLILRSPYVSQMEQFKVDGIHLVPMKMEVNSPTTYYIPKVTYHLPSYKTQGDNSIVVLTSCKYSTKAIKGYENLAISQVIDEKRLLVDGYPSSVNKDAVLQFTNKLLACVFANRTSINKPNN